MLLFLNKKIVNDELLNLYNEIVNNRNPDQTPIVNEEKFSKEGVDFEKVLEDFFPKFLFNLATLCSPTFDDENSNILRKYNNTNKELGTEKLRSKTYVDNLKKNYESYFNIEKNDCPLLKMKNFMTSMTS